MYKISKKYQKTALIIEKGVKISKKSDQNQENRRRWTENGQIVENSESEKQDKNFMTQLLLCTPDEKALNNFHQIHCAYQRPSLDPSHPVTHHLPLLTHTQKSNFFFCLKIIIPERWVNCYQ
jgi:hypothetical protein